VGAGVAFAYIVTGGTVVWPGQAEETPGPGGVANAAETPKVTTSTTPPPPPPSSVLPFNAKLVSQDIPVPGGGVRSGACSGALIAPEWIITAGHCFHDVNDVRVGGPPPYTMMVTVGKIKDSDLGGYTVQVVDVRQSPVSDLAVAKLSAAITDIVPVTLAAAAPPVGQELQFAGWGSLSPTVRGPSDHLKRGQFSVSKLRQYTLEAKPVGERTVENGPCPEDSGAPFFVSGDERTGTLIATEISGPPCPQAGSEILARVDVIATWVHEQTGNTSKSATP
jgi:secreted trypsin-like serine protease